MSESQRAQVEIARLARLLRREPATLAHLAELPAEELRRLREQVTTTLFEAGSSALEPLAAAARLLPAGLVATLGEHVFGPVLSARIAGLLEPGRAEQMTRRLPVSFLADVALELDPRRAERLLEAIAPARIAEVAAELVRRCEHTAMAGFVEHLQPPALRAATAGVHGADLLRVALVLESPERLDDILQMVSDEQLDQLVETAHREELWSALLPLSRMLAPATLGRLAGLRSIQQPAVLERIVDLAAQDRSVWEGLAPVTAHLPEPSRALVVERVRALGPAQFAEFQALSARAAAAAR